MKNLFTIFLLSIFLLSIVSAVDLNCKVGQKGSPYIISAVGDNSSQVNVTKVTYPNSSFALLGQFPMTKNGTNYNYSFTLTNTLGTYYYVTCGDEDGVLTCDDTEPRCFEITPTGNTLNISQIILYLLAAIVLIFLFFLCVYGGIVLPWENSRNPEGEVIKVNWKKYLKIFSWASAYMFLIGIVFVTWNLIYAYAQWQTLGKFFYYVYRLLMILIFPVCVSMLILLIINLLNDKKINDYIKRLGVGYDG